MKRFMFILLATFGLSSIVFAGGRYASLGKEKVSKEATGFHKKSNDFEPVFIASEPMAVESIHTSFVVIVAPKLVRQFDLVTHPRYCKRLRLISIKC